MATIGNAGDEYIPGTPGPKSSKKAKSQHTDDFIHSLAQSFNEPQVIGQHPQANAATSTLGAGVQDHDTKTKTETETITLDENSRNSLEDWREGMTIKIKIKIKKAQVVYKAAGFTL